jgi:hypothetical protein
MRLLDELAGRRLHADEQQVVREAADDLLLCQDFDGDRRAQDALTALYELSDRLVESDRLSADLARRLVAAVEDCGPFKPVG